MLGHGRLSCAGLSASPSIKTRSIAPERTSCPFVLCLLLPSCRRPSVLHVRFLSLSPNSNHRLRILLPLLAIVLLPTVVAYRTSLAVGLLRLRQLLWRLALDGVLLPLRVLGLWFRRVKVRIPHLRLRILSVLLLSGRPVHRVPLLRCLRHRCLLHPCRSIPFQDLSLPRTSYVPPCENHSLCGSERTPSLLSSP